MPCSRLHQIYALPMFAVMKRTLMVLIISLAGWLAGPAASAAEEPTNPAAADAEKENAEERYKRLAATTEVLVDQQAALQKRITELREELVRLKEDRSHDANTWVSREDLHKLTERLQEIDRKREEDKKLILEEIRKLAVAPTPAPEPSPRKVATPEPVQTTPQKGYEYTIREHDTLGSVVAAYQQSGVKVTLDQVLRANPGLRPKSLRVGQTVFIPDPAK